MNFLLDPNVAYVMLVVGFVLAVLALIPVILGEFIRAGHPSEDEYELISYGEEDDIIKPKRVIDWSQHEDLS